MQHVREAGQGAVQLEHVTDGDDALGGVGALAKTVEPTELVVVQPERRGLSKMQAPSEGPDTFGWAGLTLLDGQEFRALT